MIAWWPHVILPHGVLQTLLISFSTHVLKRNYNLLLISCQCHHSTPISWSLLTMMIWSGERKYRVRMRGIEKGASDNHPLNLVHIILTRTVIMEVTLQVVVEEEVWIFLIIGLCSDSYFTSKDFQCK
jgi:hypothetical protein